MLALLSFLAVVALSLIVVRVATAALTLTGLSDQLARFQARSAFTGAGFTTTESEKVVQHPVRRRIIMLLMLFGNAGVVTAMSSLLLSFVGEDQQFSTPTRVAFLAAGVGVLWWAAKSRWVDRQLSKLIGWALRKFTRVEARDYAGLLHLTGGYVVVELAVESGDWLCDETLSALRLTGEGLIVLGIERPNGAYRGAPTGQTKLQSGDTILIYGRREVVESLDGRRKDAAGSLEHLDHVEKQRRVEAAEASSDPAE